jgi:hypothetical protein
MKILEVEDKPGADPTKLAGLASFLAGRAENTNATKQISQDAFISLARSIGVMLTPDTLGAIISKPPINGILEPLDPNSGMISFKGADIGPAKMSVPHAQQVVDKMAKSALHKGMKK